MKGIKIISAQKIGFIKNNKIIEIKNKKKIKGKIIRIRCLNKKVFNSLKKINLLSKIQIVKKTYQHPTNQMASIPQKNEILQQKLSLKLL
jgi:hypothetical protein